MTAPSTSPSCSTTCPSSSTGSRRPRWPARWWSGPTRRTAATSWYGTSRTPSASSWSPTRPTCPWWRVLASATPSARSGATTSACSCSTPRPPEDALGPHVGSGPGGRGRPLGHPRDPRLPPLHLGDIGRAEGVPVQPGPLGPHRRHRGPDVLARAGRRLLPLHAAVPLQRADGGLGPGAGGGLGLRPPLVGPLLRFGLPPRRAGGRRDVLQLRRQAAVVHLGHARAARRRRQPARARLRERGDDRRRRPVRRAVRRRRDRLVRIHRGRRDGAADTGHALGCPGAGARGHRRARPGQRERVPARPLRRQRPAAQRRGRHR